MEQAEELDLRSWYESWEWEQSLPSPTKDEAAARARRHAAGLAFDRGRKEVGDDDSKMLAVVCCGVLAERFDDVEALVGNARSSPDRSEFDWGERVRHVVFTGWTRLLSPASKEVQETKESILALRRDQTVHEGLYLHASPEPRSAAWELVALYNLSKALDLAIDGAVSEEVEERFEHALRACLRADHYDLHSLICKLSVALRVAGSVRCK